MWRRNGDGVMRDQTIVITGTRTPLEVERCTPPATFAHVVIRTSKVDQMISWYETVLGAKIVFQNAIVCFLTYDDEHHRIALLTTAESGEGGSGNIDHIAYSYSDLGGLLGNYYRLKNLGISPVRTINHGPTISFYYRDPENIKLELQVDNFSTSEESDDFFRSAEFADNPIGVLVEPDALRDAWMAGLPWERIRKRPAMPEGATPRDMQKES